MSRDYQLVKSFLKLLRISNLLLLILLLQNSVECGDNVPIDLCLFSGLLLMVGGFLLTWSTHSRQ